MSEEAAAVAVAESGTTEKETLDVAVEGATTSTEPGDAPPASTSTAEDFLDDGNNDGEEEAAPKTPLVPTEPLPPPPEGSHPLHSEWTLWYEKKKKGVEWDEACKYVGSFNTLEGFWEIYSHLSRPELLSHKANYYMFRDRVLPAWESYPEGGCWIVKVPKKTGLISRLWEELAFAAIGEVFEEPAVVGVVVSIRKPDDLLTVWNSDCQNQTVKFQISQKLREILVSLPKAPRLEYKNNDQSMRDNSTFRNAKTYQYVVASSGGGPSGEA